VAEKIKFLADNPDVARETGENNYREIAVRYNRRKMAARYLELMREVIDGSGAGARQD